MAGKFINTQQKTTVNSLVDGFKQKLNNPYYKFIDKNKTIVTYYNLNKMKSTLDESLKTEYSRLGNNSPLRFNKINGMFLYGLERITTNLDMGDFGLESSDIEGEAYILPNTIEPIPNDYFIIDYVKGRLLFKVISVTMDTLENDNNFWKIDYKLDRLDDVDIEKLVVEEFEMLVDNVGTQYKTVIRKDDYDFISNVETVLDKLKNYYNELFYNDRVQTYTFTHKGKNFYDPFMIEFFIRHNILQRGNEDYIFITHQTHLHKTFHIMYDNTMFRWFENPELGIDKCDTPRYQAQAVYIDEIMSIFDCRPEEYFQIIYTDSTEVLTHYMDYILDTFGDEMIMNLFENKRFYGKDYRNIILDHYNGKHINGDSLYILNNIIFKDNMEFFYNIPILIYVLENDIKYLLKTYK